MSFLDNVKSPNTREIYKKAMKHFTLKKMEKNDDSNYNYLIDEFDQVIKIFQTLSNSSVKKYSDAFHFAVHYLTHFSEKIRNEYSIMYKKITTEADKQVRIKTHPLKRKTIPTTIFEVEKGGGNKKKNLKKRKKIRSLLIQITEDQYVYFSKKKIRENIEKLMNNKK